MNVDEVRIGYLRLRGQENVHRTPLNHFLVARHEHTRLSRASAKICYSRFDYKPGSLKFMLPIF